MTTGNTSPTPWMANSRSIQAANGEQVAGLHRFSAVDAANAALIVQAVNAYEPMLGTLKAVRTLLKGHGPPASFVLGELEKAIALAEGKETPHG